MGWLKGPEGASSEHRVSLVAIAKSHSLRGTKSYQHSGQRTVTVATGAGVTPEGEYLQETQLPRLFAIETRKQRSMLGVEAPRRAQPGSPPSPKILRPVLSSVVIPARSTDQPSLIDKKKLKPKNENEPVKILPQSPPPRSILAPAGAGTATGAGRKGKTPKHVLSRELQVYYSRLTTALLPPTNEQAKRAAALSSLQYDAGLQNLLPYLVRWVGERVITAIRNSNTDPDCGTSLEILLRVIHALIQNERLFMEPYVCASCVLFSDITNDGMIRYHIAAPNPSAPPLDSPYLVAAIEPANAARERSRDPPCSPPAARRDVPLALRTSHKDALIIIV